MVAQSTAINQQAAAAAATDARLATGETNVQAVVTALETRLAENERKLADALTAVSGAIVNVQQRIATSDDRVSDALTQLAGVVTQLQPQHGQPLVDFRRRDLA